MTRNHIPGDRYQTLPRLRSRRAYADLLGRHEDLGLLRETLEEEKQADEKWTELSKTISREALGDPAQESKVSSRPATKATLRFTKTPPGRVERNMLSRLRVRAASAL